MCDRKIRFRKNIFYFYRIKYFLIHFSQYAYTHIKTLQKKFVESFIKETSFEFF